MDIFSLANGRVNRITRYFRRNEGTTDYATIPAITLSGDFSGSVDFSTTTTGSATILDGSALDNANILIDILGTGSVRIQSRNSSGIQQGVISVAGSFNDGAIHTADFSLVGTTASLSIDGGTPVTTNWGSYDTANIANLYRRPNGSNIFPGIIANLRIIDAGTLVRSYPINEPSGTAIFDEVSGQDGTIVNGSDDDRGLFQEVSRGGDWLGQELWDINSITVGPDWIDNGNNNYSLNGSTGGLLAPSPVLSLVLTLRTSFALSGVTGNGVRLGSSGYFESSVNGSFSVDGNDISAFGFKRQSGAVTATLASVSVKELLKVS